MRKLRFYFWAHKISQLRVGEALGIGEVGKEPFLLPATTSSSRIHLPTVFFAHMSATKDEVELVTSVVNAKPSDKPKIAFHATMMAIQNFGFMIFYFEIWGATPYATVCGPTRYATGMMALTCFCVAFLCVGMGYGGYISDRLMFAFYWFMHLIGGSFYTASTVIVPLAHFSADGTACAALSPVNGERLTAVYTMHAALYLVYVGGMLSITWFSFLKNLLPKKKLPHPGLIVAAGLFFCVPQGIVYATLPQLSS